MREKRRDEFYMETRRKSSWMLWTCWVLHVSNNFFHCSEFQSFHCLISSLCCLLSPNPLPSPFALILHLVLTHPTARDTSRTQPAAAAASMQLQLLLFSFVRSSVPSTLFPLVSPNPTLYYILFLFYPSPLFQSRKRPLT